MLSSSELLPAEKANVYRSTQGTVSIWRPAPTVVATRVEGVLTIEGARAIEVATRRAVDEDHRLISFHDWSDMSDYETASRIQLTRVGAEFIRVTDGIHLTLRSKLVALGVQAASLVLKNVTVHPTRESFLQLLHETVQRKRRS